MPIINNSGGLPDLLAKTIIGECVIILSVSQAVFAQKQFPHDVYNVWDLPKGDMPDLHRDWRQSGAAGIRPVNLETGEWELTGERSVCRLYDSGEESMVKGRVYHFDRIGRAMELFGRIVNCKVLSMVTDRTSGEWPDYIQDICPFSTDLPRDIIDMARVQTALPATANEARHIAETEKWNDEVIKEVA